MSHRTISLLNLCTAFFLGVACTFFLKKDLPRGKESTVSPSINSLEVPDTVEEMHSDSDSESMNSGENTPSAPPPFFLAPASASNLSTPIPLEWEQPLFAILNQTNPALRNQGLVNMAINTAKNAPRIQAECLKHLTYSLSEEEYPQFLFLIRNPALPMDVKLEFLSDTLRIRKSEFAYWLAKTFLNDPQAPIANLAKIYLKTSP